MTWPALRSGVWWLRLGRLWTSLPAPPPSSQKITTGSTGSGNVVLVLLEIAPAVLQLGIPVYSRKTEILLSPAGPLVMCHGHSPPSSLLPCRLFDSLAAQAAEGFPPPRGLTKELYKIITEQVQRATYMLTSSPPIRHIRSARLVWHRCKCALSSCLPILFHFGVLKLSLSHFGAFLTLFPSKP